tara:strand:- start:261 stop:434 length:174 start_codon:yes stop_codon:yes gene_type:complete
MSKNTQLPPSSFLFAKPNFEKSLKEEATKSISSQKKYDSLLGCLKGALAEGRKVARK